MTRPDLSLVVTNLDLDGEPQVKEQPTYTRSIADKVEEIVIIAEAIINTKDGAKIRLLGEDGNVYEATSLTPSLDPRKSTRPSDYRLILGINPNTVTWNYYDSSTKKIK
jgi:hypothetical protein